MAWVNSEFLYQEIVIKLVAGERDYQNGGKLKMEGRYNYYKSLPGYLSLTANVTLVAGVVMLFFDWHVSIPLFIATVVLWFIARNAHKKRVFTASTMAGLNESAKILAEKYKTPEKIAELKKMGFGNEAIQALRKIAQEDAKKGIFRKMDTPEEIEKVLQEVAERMEENKDSI